MNNNTEHIEPVELLTKYFAGETSEAENTQLAEWRKAMPENEEEYIRFEKLWNYSGSDALKSEINIDKEWNYLNSKISGKEKPVFGVGRIIAIAASILLIISLGIVGIRSTQYISQKTGNTETAEYILPDGSIINLNANSKITYNKKFGEGSRKLKLQGEAFFNVTPNKEVPFVISTRQASIEVVGTKFNVKAYKHQAEVKVTVTSGKVNLSSRKEPRVKTLIIAGETGNLKKENLSVEKIELENINDYAWKTLEMSFNNADLPEVADVLENTYHISVQLEEKLKNCRITVSFENQDLADVLKVLKSTLGLKIQVENNTIILSGSGCIQE
ncbi:MAG: FecR domain-containing protein [Bacteroidales bacterium]|nr:FecR domain-containing protein [Bacteroidales bacterium]MBN2819068.1 FecR domain-containing protein [Bacteroidales bacterium]